MATDEPGSRPPRFDVLDRTSAHNLPRQRPLDVGASAAPIQFTAGPVPQSLPSR